MAWSCGKPEQMIAFGPQWPSSPYKAFGRIAACSMCGRGKVTFLISGQWTLQMQFSLLSSALIFQGIGKLLKDFLVVLNLIIAVFPLPPLVLPCRLSVDVSNA